MRQGNRESQIGLRKRKKVFFCVPVSELAIKLLMHDSPRIRDARPALPNGNPARKKTLFIFWQAFLRQGKVGPFFFFPKIFHHVGGNGPLENREKGESDMTGEKKLTRA